MNIYAYYGHTDFYIALGYKAVIEDYFKNFKLIEILINYTGLIRNWFVVKS